MRQIREEQLEPALALEPDLVSIVGGLNDILRPRIDFDQVVGDLEQMVSAFAARGATVLGMTFPDAARIMPRGPPREAARPTPSTVAVRAIADRHGMLIADLERHGVVDRRLWSVDRLHANSPGTRGSPPPWRRRSGSSPTRIRGRRFHRPTRSPRPGAFAGRARMDEPPHGAVDHAPRSAAARRVTAGRQNARRWLPQSSTSAAKRPPNSLESGGRAPYVLSRGLMPRCGARRARACPPAGPARAPRALAPARPRSRAPSRSAEASAARLRRGRSAGG